MYSTRLSAFSRSCTTLQRGFATVAKDFRIPVIDFSKYRKARTSAERKVTADEVVAGFKESGFIYVDKHGIPPAIVRGAFQKSAEFFALPPDTKDKLRWEDPRSNRGYVTIGRERVTQSADPNEIAALREKAPDFKESMEIGRDWDATWKNQYRMEKLSCSSRLALIWMNGILTTRLMTRIITSGSCHTLLFSENYWRATGQARAGAHSDYGTLTLLFQDQVGGLEVQDPHTGLYYPATPIPGTIVINVGDLLSRWSNDTLRSTLHRVVAPPAKQISETEVVTPARQSIAYFSNPNFTTEISCLPNCGKEAKYPPVNTETYIVGRLAATYM
ncbi:uncharacterized protein EV420DRAFT_1640277 [Desarmillaria tabescens]|uniref:Fe2OG dioxygenase domain-containing protein n=1 Tax=Armillaria tabescens TaxID=1929756 RepID=A0AA39TK80_ARMTA|nr:uncharacterized protein EV420DRAFT_1640277 [Desarmillaria tabescens]KAK0461982.1 hypothetical protein EV420DRAFT_1640277 [Desarmillaria tabescens]